MIESPFDVLADAWASGDPAAVSALFHADASWIVDGRVYQGRPAIAAAVHAILAQAPCVRAVLRRAFHDRREPQWWVAEWAFRTGGDDGAGREIEQGLLLDLTDGRIAHLRTHNDHRSVRRVAMDAPLREEVWPAAIPPRTRDMSYEEIVATQLRHVMQGWARGDDEVVVGCHAPTSIIQTSFEVVRGHDQLRRAVKAYYENYADTRIKIHRIVYSGDFLAINQTWYCRNRKTGVYAGDQDLNIGVMQDGKLWRWREYYDSTQSAQTLEQTVFGQAADATSGGLAPADSC